MKKSQLSEWLKTINWLKRDFKPRHNVIVQSVKMSTNEAKTDGAAEYRAPNFYITINRKINYASKIDTLLHEWAHVLTWNGYDACQEKDHGGEWGLAYSKIYDSFVKWNHGE